MGLYRGTDVAGGAIHFYSPQNLSLSNANTRVVCAQFSVILVKCANEVFCAKLHLMNLVRDIFTRYQAMCDEQEEGGGDLWGVIDIR